MLLLCDNHANQKSPSGQLLVISGRYDGVAFECRGYACSTINLIGTWREQFSARPVRLPSISVTFNCSRKVISVTFTFNSPSPVQNDQGTTSPTFPFGLVSLHAGGSEGHEFNMANFRHAQTAGYGFLPGPAGSGMENTFVAQAYDAGDPGDRIGKYTSNRFFASFLLQRRGMKQQGDGDTRCLMSSLRASLTDCLRLQISSGRPRRWTRRTRAITTSRYHL